LHARPRFLAPSSGSTAAQSPDSSATPFCPRPLPAVQRARRRRRRGGQQPANNDVFQDQAPEAKAARSSWAGPDAHSKPRFESAHERSSRGVARGSKGKLRGSAALGGAAAKHMAATETPRPAPATWPGAGGPAKGAQRAGAGAGAAQSGVAPQQRFQRQLTRRRSDSSPMVLSSSRRRISVSVSLSWQRPRGRVGPRPGSIAGQAQAHTNQQGSGLSTAARNTPCPATKPREAARRGRSTTSAQVSATRVCCVLCVACCV